ncbi:MAG: (d)CMP kinase [Chloroflexota bacterium]|nr:(d)CMP kinase [Chloroflexota bacterium]
MSNSHKIAIDGPVAAGKTVVGSTLANRLGFTYLDTGVMYRAVAWAVRAYDIDQTDILAIEQIAVDMDLHVDEEDGAAVVINGISVKDELRDPEVTKLSSVVATLADVRKTLVILQRVIADKNDIVMVGRDIGTVVLPNADLKIYITASVEERARRRFNDMRSEGLDTSFESVLEQTKDRDARDSTRNESPLLIAYDAVTIDTVGLSVDETVELIIGRFQECRS